MASQSVGKVQAVMREWRDTSGDSEGSPVIGLQAKFFPEKFGADQWRKIDESVRDALNDTTADCSLKRFVVATPRAFNKTENEKWKRYQNGWQQHAKQIGYRSAVKFAHWGFSILEGFLKEDKNRGQLLILVQLSAF